MKVTLAVVGDATVPFGQGLPGGEPWNEEMKVPYDERRLVELQVQESEALGEVLMRACHEIGLELSRGGIGFIDFYREGEEVTPRHEVTVLDAEGRVEWVGRWKEVSYDRLLHADEADVLAGDARRPYLILKEEVGNGVLITLAVLYGGWKLFWEVVDNFERAGKLTAAIKKLVHGSGGAREAGDVVEGHYREWQLKGARPDNLRRFLGEHEWSLDHLGDVLGCTTAEAEALLLGFGHERGKDGLWRPGESEEARFLRGTNDLLLADRGWAEADLKRVLHERTAQFLQSGRAPEIEWPSLDIGKDPDRLATIMDDRRAIYEELLRRTRES